MSAYLVSLRPMIAIYEPPPQPTNVVATLLAADDVDVTN